MNACTIYTNVNPTSGIQNAFKEWLVGKATTYRAAIVLAQSKCAYGTWWIVSAKQPTREEQLNIPDVKSTKQKPSKIQNILNSI
jgi:hypothetical protein